MDAKAEVRMIQLLCPLCVAKGNTEPVETSTDSAWLPALLEKYVPEIKRKEGFISLNEAITKAPQFEALVDTSGRRREAKVICFDHSRDMRTANIWTTKYSVVLEMRARAAASLAARRAEEQAERERNAFDSIGSILSGKQSAAVSESQGVEPEEDDASAEAREAQEAVQRKLAADAGARSKIDEDGKKKGKGGRKRQPYDRSSSRREAAAARD